MTPDMDPAGGDLTIIQTVDGKQQRLYGYPNAVEQIDRAIDNGRALHTTGRDDDGNENTLIINPRNIVWAKHYEKGNF